MSAKSSSIPFHDEASRRQWESSIGIKHSTPKCAENSLQNCRLYSNPLKDRVDNHRRPVSPLLNLDEDRMNIDEYADCAGHFFSDIMTSKVRSRSSRRQTRGTERQPHPTTKNNAFGRIYSEPSVLPKLKGYKQISNKLQNRDKSSHTPSNLKPVSSTRRHEGSVAFEGMSLFDDDISTLLTRYEHSSYAMIPGKLFKYEDMVESSDLSDLQEMTATDLSVPYNISMRKLKDTVLEIFHGKKKWDKKTKRNVLSCLKVWVYQEDRCRWQLMVTESPWTHAKLRAQEGKETLRLMYSTSYQSSYASNEINSSSVLTETSPSGDISILSDDLPPCEFLSEAYEIRNARTLNRLNRLDCHTPNPPDVDMVSMSLLKNDDGTGSLARTFFDSMPKEQAMANLLETRLMKSRY